MRHIDNIKFNEIYISDDILENNMLSNITLLNTDTEFIISNLKIFNKIFQNITSLQLCDNFDVILNDKVFNIDDSMCNYYSFPKINHSGEQWRKK